ncbi:conserved hypothetical protein [Streptomyces himastatinicus ATCC 53653]|uniref:DUF397 domain-containing protein n=1 Tax=Streptomyces himastatinicus ATCC 53653 TaxID=457427 RepID=D9W798_9ACTN|nr:DUF397 domain-containing protein [Streptomyces himastatinicus]EFL26709.1 conserved hypothetical protein [Streptomyces himastatinicus ATCC 53653]
MSDLKWRKSGFSGGGGSGECVEVAAEPRGLIFLRESDDPAVVIATDPARWAAFVRGAKQGNFDDLS